MSDSSGRVRSAGRLRKRDEVLSDARSGSRRGAFGGSQEHDCKQTLVQNRQDLAVDQERIEERC